MIWRPRLALVALAVPAGMAVRFGRLEADKTWQFTPLGNYRAFLTRQIVVEGASKIAAAQKGKAEASDAALKASEARPEEDDSEILASTAIKLVVR